MKLISSYLRALRSYHVSLYLTDSGGAIKATGIFPELCIEWDGGIGYEGPALCTTDKTSFGDALDLVARVGCDDALPALRGVSMDDYVGTTAQYPSGYDLPDVPWTDVILSCVSDDDCRANLRAPFVRYTSNVTYVVATDGYSLAAVCDRPEFVHSVEEAELETYVPLDIIHTDKKAVVCESCVSENGGYVILFSGCGATVRISWTAVREWPPKWPAVIPAPTEAFGFDVLCTKLPKSATKTNTRVGLIYSDDGVPLNALIYHTSDMDILAVVDPDGIIDAGTVEVSAAFQGAVLGRLHKVIREVAKDDVYVDAVTCNSSPIAIGYGNADYSMLVLAVPLRDAGAELEILPAHLA